MHRSRHRLVRRQSARAAGACAALLVAGPAFAQQGIELAGTSAGEEPRLLATRANEPISLDGVLDEAAWAGAPVASGFVQNEPFEGRPASFDTEVRVLYDDRAVYFGVFARDDQPGSLVV